MIKKMLCVIATTMSASTFAQAPDPKQLLSYTDAVNCYAISSWQLSFFQSSTRFEKYYPVAVEVMGASKALAYNKGAATGKGIQQVNKDFQSASLSLISEIEVADGAASDALLKELGRRFFLECAAKGLATEASTRRLAEQR